MQRCLKEFHEIRPYYYEDYYPLTGTEDMTRDDIWLAYQMHRPSDDGAIIVAFRRTASKDKKITVRQVAIENGFPNVNSFILSCKSEYGRTPAELRNYSEKN